MLDEKQIWAIFLFEFKMGCKAMETTWNIYNAFDPGTAKEHIVQWWFKKFCKGDESLEDEEHSGWPSGVDKDPLRAVVNSDPLTTMQEVVKNSTSTILLPFGIWSKLERWKNSSRCLMS